MLFRRNKMAKETTRNKILEVGSSIIHKKGFNNTGIQEILDKAGVPKGSFYFYFKSKEDFGLAIIDQFESMVCGHLASVIEDESLAPLARLKRFFSSLRHFFQEQNCSRGCPIGNLSQELSDVNENIRQRLEKSFITMGSLIERCLYAARIKGELSEDLPVPETADYIINSWEGALLRMKVSRDIEPLLVFERVLFDTILK
jgi:TetR/AcrR family transcriptional repressor of nem operon